MAIYLRIWVFGSSGPAKPPMITEAGRNINLRHNHDNGTAL